MKKSFKEQTTAGIHAETSAILDSISDGVFTVDRKWRITSFHRAGIRCFQASSDDGSNTMGFYIYVRNGVIEDAKYHTEGCGNTRACGHVVARRAKGRKATDALSISAGEILRSNECEPEAGRHCAILAVSTFYRALADYLLKP